MHPPAWLIFENWKFGKRRVNSANELQAHLIMARDFGAMGRSDSIALRERLVQVRKMLHGLKNRLNGIRSREASVDVGPKPAAD